MGTPDDEKTMDVLLDEYEELMKNSDVSQGLKEVVFQSEWRADLKARYNPATFSYLIKTYKAVNDMMKVAVNEEFGKEVERLFNRGSMMDFFNGMFLLLGKHLAKNPEMREPMLAFMRYMVEYQVNEHGLQERMAYIERKDPHEEGIRERYVKAFDAAVKRDAARTKDFLHSALEYPAGKQTVNDLLDFSRYARLGIAGLDPGQTSMEQFIDIIIKQESMVYTLEERDAKDLAGDLVRRYFDLLELYVTLVYAMILGLQRIAAGEVTPPFGKHMGYYTSNLRFGKHFRELRNSPAHHSVNIIVDQPRKHINIQFLIKRKNWQSGEEETISVDYSLPELMQKIKGTVKLVNVIMGHARFSIERIEKELKGVDPEKEKKDIIAKMDELLSDPNKWKELFNDIYVQYMRGIKKGI
ncbi:MAG: hypothetical protein ACFFCS_11185 [Candidatus Hodarchaeota archaeon]